MMSRKYLLPNNLLPQSEAEVGQQKQWPACEQGTEANDSNHSNGWVMHVEIAVPEAVEGLA